MSSEDSLKVDVIIIGAGPSGLATAIHLANLAKENNKSLDIVVLEKGSQVGAHIISGAVLETSSLAELIPDWQQQSPPTYTAVNQEKFMFLTKSHAFNLPTPAPMKNTGNYIISLSQYCSWLAAYAESLGVQIFPGFCAAEFIYDDSNTKIIGIKTKEQGIDRNGEHKSSYQPGMNIYASYTVLAEGCRGFLSEKIIKKFNLRKSAQTYGLGVKEVWKIDSKLNPGLVIHTIGWPLDNSTYGGSFIYIQQPDLMFIGFVVGLDYSNPSLNPYAELQKFKHHPAIKKYFVNAKRISYGARCINEGGWQSIPKLAFPGGLIVGCAAGFVNVPKIKGIHNAIRSGMHAAKSIFQSLEKDKPDSTLATYEHSVLTSQIGKELYKVRNIRPAFKRGLLFGLAYSAIETYIFKNKTFWTFKHHLDHEQLKPAAKIKAIKYEKHDGKISFDKLRSVFLSGTNHEENQPVHLIVKNKEILSSNNIQLYNSPESNYCPAQVYELIKNPDGSYKVQINGQNCLHCKACDIKDPKQNIMWTLPEAGGGPNYTNM